MLKQNDHTYYTRNFEYFEIKNTDLTFQEVYLEKLDQNK